MGRREERFFGTADVPNFFRKPYGPGYIMKTIGVLGGLGPQATMDFEARVHSVSQQVLPAEANTGYPPMVVYYYRHSPFLMQHTHMPVLPLQADARLLEAAKKLGGCADFLVIPSNGVQ